MKTEIYVDFDGTITQSEGGTAAPPRFKCVDAINKLYESGKFTIYIYSCRSNPDVCGTVKRQIAGDNPSPLELKWASQSAEEEMIDYLETHGIKYHYVVPNKPHYHFIIDDRAINPSAGWDTILKMLDRI